MAAQVARVGEAAEAATQVGAKAGKSALQESSANAIPKKGLPKPAQNFVAPTNKPQLPPTTLPDGYSVRAMPSTEQYPNGYWRMYNKNGQPVNPSTGKPPANVTKSESAAQTHVPLPPKE